VALERPDNEQLRGIELNDPFLSRISTNTKTCISRTKIIRIFCRHRRWHY